MTKNIIEKNKFKILLVYPNLPLMLIPPLSMAIFTSIYKKQGYIVDLFDTSSYVPENLDSSSPQNQAIYLNVREFSDEDDLGYSIKTDLHNDYRNKILKFKPNFIVYSVVEDAFPRALKMMKSINNINLPFVRLVGGILPSADPNYVLSKKEINFVSQGEGEKTLVEAAEAVRLKKSLIGVKGTYFKDKNGKIHKAEPQPLVDINDYEQDFSLFEQKRFFRPIGGRIFKTMPIETYRGCPFKCTYCNSPMHNTYVKNEGVAKSFSRRKTIPKIRKDIKNLIKLYNPNFFWFVDDSFLARPKKEIFDFCDMYEEFKIPFWFNTRPENCNPDILQRLKEVGTNRMSFGLECGNESFRTKVLLRKPTNDDIINSYNMIADSKIAYSINLIIGFPGETRELVMETVDLVKKIKGYDSLTVSIFTPYRGTVLREVAVKNGWLDEDHVTVHTTSYSVLKMPKPYLNSKEIDGLMRVMPLYIFFPKSEWDMIKRAEIDDNEGNKIRKYYADIYKEKFLGENQDSKKDLIIDDDKLNPKKNYKYTQDTPLKLTDNEIKMLTLMS